MEGLPLSIWRALSRVICWGIWKERNSRMFEDKSCSMEEMVIHIYKSLFEWALVWECFEDGEWEAIWYEEL